MADERDESIEAAPFGIPFKVRGREMGLVLVIFILVMGLGWMVNFVMAGWGAPFDLKAWSTSHSEEMEKQHRQYVNAVNEFSYVVSVCMNKSRQDECQRLRFAMPDSMYRKLLD